ncbi:MAG: hypothetical protein C0599_06115 [Salinivirgaceae bacterium]|nr:MAG: hypothetical protein C0599_06115 [Salinivirgaceae bacterium]
MKLRIIHIIPVIALIILNSCVIKEPDDIYSTGEGGSSSGVNFEASSTSISPGGTVYFTNKSSNKYDYFYWEFGDGNFSSSEDPSHTYYEVGYYDVTLYGWSLDGDEDVETKYGYIGVIYGGGNSYCQSYGGTSYEWIESVFLNDYSNYSGNDGGYGDYTSEVIYLPPGNYVYIETTPGFTSSTYTEYFNIWIDYNNDGDFEDSGELVAQGSGSSVVSGDIYIDEGATGTTRMRISMSDGQYRGPCETFTYGEVEDYTVNFDVLKKSNRVKPPSLPVKLKPKNGDTTIKTKK